MPENCNISQYNLNLFFKIIIDEKITTSLNNDNFFFNIRILAFSFAESQFTEHIQLLLNQKCRKTQYFTIPLKPYFETDLEKIETSLNINIFFSNNQIQTKSFEDSQFT